VTGIGSLCCSLVFGWITGAEESMLLTSFKQKNDYLAPVEVDEVWFHGWGNYQSFPHNAVSGGVELLVTLFFNMGHSVLYIIFLQCLRSILHWVLQHIGIFFYHGFSVSLWSGGCSTAYFHLGEGLAMPGPWGPLLLIKAVVHLTIVLYWVTFIKFSKSKHP